MIKIGEVITLDNQEEYSVVEKVEIKKQEYFLLMSVTMPVKIRVCIEEENDVITLIEDKKIIKEVLLKLIEK